MNSFCFSSILFLIIISPNLCWACIQKGDDWDEVVGSVVREITAKMLKKEGNYIDVDDTTYTFGGFLLDGKIKATGGSIGNFSTLSLVNLTVSNTSDSLTVLAKLKFGQLEILYSSFEASVGFLSVGGSFHAAVGSNLLNAEVTMKLDGDECEDIIFILELSEFGGVDLSKSGVDLFNNKLFNKVANTVVDNFVPELKAAVEGKLRKLIFPYVASACKDFGRETKQCN